MALCAKLFMEMFCILMAPEGCNCCRTESFSVWPPWRWEYFAKTIKKVRSALEKIHCLHFVESVYANSKVTHQIYNTISIECDHFVGLQGMSTKDGELPINATGGVIISLGWPPSKQTCFYFVRVNINHARVLPRADCLRLDQLFVPFFWTTPRAVTRLMRCVKMFALPTSRLTLN